MKTQKNDAKTQKTRAKNTQCIIALRDCSIVLCCHQSRRILYPFFFLLCSLFPHTPDVSWTLLSTTASPLPMAGLCNLEDACRVLFIQIFPFAHTVKTLQLSLVETCPNSVPYFEDSSCTIYYIDFLQQFKIILDVPSLRYTST